MTAGRGSRGSQGIAGPSTDVSNSLDPRAASKEVRRKQQARYRARRRDQDARLGGEVLSAAMELEAAREEREGLQAEHRGYQQLLDYQAGAMAVMQPGAAGAPAGRPPLPPPAAAAPGEAEGASATPRWASMLWECSREMVARLATHVVWQTNYVPPEHVVKTVVLASREEGWVAREAAFLSTLQQHMALWQQAPAARPRIEARLRAAFTREDMAMLALAEHRLDLTQRFILARMPPPPERGPLHPSMQAVGEALHAAITPAQRTAVRESWLRYCARVAECRHKAAGSLAQLHAAARAQMQRWNVEAGAAAGASHLGAQAHMDVAATTAQARVYGEAEMQATVRLIVEFAESLTLTQRAQLRLGCLPFLPDVVQLSQFLILPQAPPLDLGGAVAAR